MVFRIGIHRLTPRSAYSADISFRRDLRVPNPRAAFSSALGRITETPDVISPGACSEATKNYENMNDATMPSPTFRFYCRAICTCLSHVTDVYSRWVKADEHRTRTRSSRSLTRRAIDFFDIASLNNSRGSLCGRVLSSTSSQFARYDP